MKDFLQILLGFIIIFSVVFVIDYILGTIACTSAGRMLRTSSMYSFDKCYVMNADGDYIPEEVYLELLKYGE